MQLRIPAGHEVLLAPVHQRHLASRRQVQVLNVPPDERARLVVGAQRHRKVVVGVQQGLLQFHHIPGLAPALDKVALVHPGGQVGQRAQVLARLLFRADQEKDRIDPLPLFRPLSRCTGVLPRRVVFCARRGALRKDVRRVEQNALPAPHQDQLRLLDLGYAQVGQRHTPRYRHATVTGPVEEATDKARRRDRKPLGKRRSHLLDEVFEGHGRFQIEHLRADDQLFERHLLGLRLLPGLRGQEHHHPVPRLRRHRPLFRMHQQLAAPDHEQQHHIPLVLTQQRFVGHLLGQLDDVELPSLIESVVQHRKGHLASEQGPTPEVRRQGAVFRLLLEAPGQLVDRRALENFGKVEGRQRVDFIVGRQRQKPPDPAEIKFIDNRFGKRIDGNGGKVAATGPLDVVDVRVDQHHPVAEVLQQHGQAPGPQVRAQEKQALRIRLGEAQVTRQRGDGQAIDGHRADDHQEHERHQPADLVREDGFQAEGKQRGHGRRHDATRRHPRKKHLLPPVQVRPDRRDPHRHRSDEQNEYAEENQGTLVDVGQRRQFQPGTEHDKEAGDQEHLQVFLELGDPPHRHVFLIRHHDAHERHLQQAGFLLQDVRQGERADDDHQRNRTLQVVRHQTPMQEQDQQGGPDDADPHTDGDREQQPLDGVQNRVPDTAGLAHHRHRLVQQQDRFQHQHGQDGPDRIDRDPLPFRHRADASRRTYMAQQRDHHGRPCHRQDGTDQDRERQVEPGDVVSGQTGQDPGHQYPHGDEVQNRLAHLPQFGQTQAQPALEQDDPNGEGDEGEEPVSLQR